VNKTRAIELLFRNSTRAMVRSPLRRSLEFELRLVGYSVGEPRKNDFSLTQALGYSHSQKARDHEKPVRCDSGESGKDPAVQTP
jgi:hypothetical protein